MRAARLPHRNPRAARYFVCSCRRRSIACAICSCSSAIFVKPFFRKLFARTRCHSGDSSRRFSRSSSVDIGRPLEEAAARGACRAGDLLGAHSRASAPMRTPPRAWGFRRRLSGVPKSLGGTLGLGSVGGTPEGVYYGMPFIGTLQAQGCLLPFLQPLP